MRKWLAAAVLVTLGALLSPNAVPIYDGIGTDQPYRYVGSSKEPSAPSVTTKVNDGKSGSLQLKSSEIGPQLLVDLAAGAFTATTSELTLHGTPLAGTGSEAGVVPRGSIDGNIYRITVTSGATLDADNAQGFMFLRAAVMTTGPIPVIVHRLTPSSPWKEVATTRSGRDILATPFREVGDYAVVRLPGSKTLSQSSGIGGSRLIFLIAGVGLLVIITILVLRRPSTDEDD